jgi:hypothetical protein
VSEPRGTSLKSDLALLSIPAWIKLLIHFATNGRYGYFRDELYYLACADHLGWGYVDHPPLSIAVLGLFRAVLGESIFAIRLPAVLASFATVIVAGLIARELGGKRFAQLLTATSVAIAPIFLSLATFYSMNALDHLFWAVLLLILVRIINRNEPAAWLWFGLVAGLGLMNKISVGVLGVGVVIGLLLTPHRNHLKKPWIYAGGALALLLFVPHLLWQAVHGWPTLEFMHNARAYKMAAMPPLAFAGAQILYLHPLNLPLWVAGAAYLMFAPRMAPYRILAWTFLAVVILLLVQQAKPYYAAPAFLAVLPAGAVAFDRVAMWAGPPSARWLKGAAVALLVVGGAVTLPLAIPLLPPERYAAYAQRLGISPPQEEKREVEGLPQHLADRFGWETLVEAVADVYAGLSEHERAHTVIVGSNYGDAGAIDFFGKRYGLPRAVSTHNSYYLWGSGATSGQIAIAVGLSREALEEIYESVEEAARIRCPYCMPGERTRTIYLCRGLKLPLEQVWQRAKMFI